MREEHSPVRAPIPARKTRPTRRWRGVPIGLLVLVIAPLGAFITWMWTRWPIGVKAVAAAWAVYLALARIVRSLRSPAAHVASLAAQREGAAATSMPVSPATPGARAPDGELRAALDRALGKGNREGLDRLGDVFVHEQSGASPFITVSWAINHSRNIKRGAQRDVANILRAVAKSDLEFQTIVLIGTFALRDAFGKVREGQVLCLRFDRSTVNRINRKLFNSRRVYDIAGQPKGIHWELR